MGPDNDDDDDDDDDDDEDADDNKQEDDDDDILNKKAVKLLFDLILKCGEAMKLKIARNNSQYNKDNIAYLNMLSLYKNKEEKSVDIMQINVIDRVVNGIYDTVIQHDDYKDATYDFLRNNENIRLKLHEFIARGCELICNMLYYKWDLCPLSFYNKNETLIKFDDRIHIKDNDLSHEDYTDKIGYCCFPGIIADSCWYQFNSQYNKNQITNQQIQKVLKYKMSVSLYK